MDFTGTVCVEHLCQEPPDTSWACVGNVKTPVETDPAFQSTIRIYDLLSNAPPPEGTVRLCRKFDPACSAPLLSTPLPVDGLVTTTVAANFTGFYLIETPVNRPGLFFIDTQGPAGESRVSLLTPAAVEALNGSLHATPAPNSGSVNISMFDCNNKRAAGVHFSVDTTEPSLPFYVLSGSLSSTATATDPGGNAGFASLAEGTVTITATLESTGQVLARVATLIRANAITYQPMRPTPFD